MHEHASAHAPYSVHSSGGGTAGAVAQRASRAPECNVSCGARQAAFTVVFSFQVGVITSYWDTQVRARPEAGAWCECCGAVQMRTGVQWGGCAAGPTLSKPCRGGSWHPCSASTPHPDQPMACASTRGPSSVPCSCSVAPEQWHCSAVAPARPRRSQPCQQSRAASAWRIILEGAERADAPRAAGGADGAGGDRGRGGRLLRARLPHAAGLHQVRALAARRRGCGARACGGLAHGSDPDHNPKSGASPGTLQQRHADLGPGRASFGPWRGAGLTAGARGAQAARLPDRLQLHLHVCRLLRAGHRLHVVRAPSRSPRARGQQPPGLHARCAALDPLPRGPPPAGMH